MLADALGVKISRVSIEGLSNPNLRPMAVCELIPTYPVSSAIVIALAGQAVDETLSIEQQCQASSMEYETDCARLAECIPEDCPEDARAHFWQKIHALRDTWVAEWVRHHRLAIIAFAERLRMEIALSGAELASALQDSWSGSKPNESELSAEVGQIVANAVLLGVSPTEPSSAV